MSDDSERLFNMCVFKCYATNKEMEEMGPFFLFLLVVFIAIAVCITMFSKEEEPAVPMSIAVEQTEQVQLKLEKDDT